MPSKTVIPASAAYLNTDQAAVYLSMSVQWLEIARHRGGGPRYSKIGGAVQYSRADLDAFMAANLHHSTREYSPPSALGRPRTKRPAKGRARP